MYIGHLNFQISITLSTNKCFSVQLCGELYGGQSQYRVPHPGSLQSVLWVDAHKRSYQETHIRLGQIVHDLNVQVKKMDLMS